MDLTLPHLGEGADSGTVVNLFVKEGDDIAKDQPVLELENEKAVATIPSTSAGKVTKIYIKAGDKISVGQKILSLTGGPSAPGDTQEKKKDKAAPKPEAREKKAEPEPEEAQAAGDGERATADYDAPSQPGDGAAAPAASPSLRKMARDLGIDLRRVRGTERGGRIVLADVRAYIQKLQGAGGQAKAKAAAGQAARPAQEEQIDFAKWGPVSRKPMSQLRQVIARRMTESWTTVPHVTQFDEADITDLNALRKNQSAAYEKQGTHLTLTSFALKAVANALKKHPAFNSSLDSGSQEIVFKEYCHIGVAVDTEAGLIVPVIRDVDKKSLLDLSKELESAAKKARERKFSADDLKGGCFTISNQGGIGGGHFTPIVNKPEVAILGMGRGALRPVLKDKKIEPRLILPLALSYDHRVIDGAAAARFMVELVKEFQDFSEQHVKL